MSSYALQIPGAAPGIYSPAMGRHCLEDGKKAVEAAQKGLFFTLRTRRETDFMIVSPPSGENVSALDASCGGCFSTSVAAGCRGRHTLPPASSFLPVSGRPCIPIELLSLSPKQAPWLLFLPQHLQSLSLQHSLHTLPGQPPCLLGVLALNFQCICTGPCR